MTTTAPAQDPARGPGRGHPTGDPAAPPAIRSRRPGWRDPRIVLGVAIMAVSVLLGAWALSSADDTVAVTVARHDLPAGAVIGPDDVATRQVHFADPSLAAAYIGAGALPDRASLGRAVGAGELVPRSALHHAGRGDRVQVPLSVAADDLPGTVGVGSVVDVWVVPDRAHSTDRPGRARLVLHNVTVLRLGDSGDSLTPEATRQVIITVPAASAGSLPVALGRATAGRLLLTKRG